MMWERPATQRGAALPYQLEDSGWQWGEDLRVGGHVSASLSHPLPDLVSILLLKQL